jgi:hypothetical protein
VTRITYSDNIRADVGDTYVWRSGNNGEVSLHVSGDSGRGAEMRLYTGDGSVERRDRALKNLTDLHTAIGELLAELHKRGERT